MGSQAGLNSCEMGLSHDSDINEGSKIHLSVLLTLVQFRTQCL